MWQRVVASSHDVQETEPVTRISVASIEEMSHGTIDDLKTFAFELRTPRKKFRLAADTEEGASVLCCGERLFAST